jgi:hypothetical protein
MLSERRRLLVVLFYNLQKVFAGNWWKRESDQPLTRIDFARNRLGTDEDIRPYMIQLSPHIEELPDY